MAHFVISLHFNNRYLNEFKIIIIKKLPKYEENRRGSNGGSKKTQEGFFAL